MSYAEITFGDKNPIKRWPQRERLASAIKAYRQAGLEPRSICDFGAGNGELCKGLALAYPKARIVCYEPAPHLLAEARSNLASLAPRIEFQSNIGAVQPDSIDAVFCLEVFEHLPPAETEAALARISTLLAPQGKAVIGVPVEIGLPALYKGLFRMCRRYGTFDANVKNVCQAFAGFPPHPRPMSEIAPGLNFHSEHLGFDHRRLARQIRQHFGACTTQASPFGLIGPRLMPEINFVAG